MCRCLAAVVVVMVAACSDTEEPAAPVLVAPAAVPAPRKRPTVRWANVQRTSGCFFFSGPEGRDDKITGDVIVDTAERDGDRYSVRIGTATYAGTYRDGALSLSRTSTHDFHGPWTSTETIIGRHAGEGIVARYHYEECERAAVTCPGTCKIDGDITFSRAD